MKKAAADFAKYLPVTNDGDAWGVAVRAGGRITNAPGRVYPPAGHPADHAFAWEHGRVLGAWQVVMIAAGGGEFEGRRRGGVEAVGAGDVLWITPGQWHRYRPAERTGWVELWIELDGPVLGRLTEAGLLPGKNGVRRGLDAGVVGEVIARLHGSLGSGVAAEVAAEGVRLLGLLSGRDAEGEAPLVRAVRRAERVLAERIEESSSMPTLARELGVGYAGFRREFKRRTGLAPRQYLLRLRLERAQRLLGSTPAKLEEIAAKLGFSSAFHLSAAFKARYGVAPAVWRQGREA
jgi:AraC-like DNA-binding protein